MANFTWNEIVDRFSSVLIEQINNYYPEAQISTLIGSKVVRTLRDEVDDQLFVIAIPGVPKVMTIRAFEFYEGFLGGVSVEDPGD